MSLVENNIQMFLNSSDAIINVDNLNSDVYFDLTRIELDDAKLIYVSVQSAQIPYSFFNVDTGTDKLYFNGVPYTIPEGNYNATTLATKIQSLIPNLVVVYSSLNNKYSFTYTSDFTFNSQTTIFELLGFPRGNNYTSTGGILYSTQSVNFFTVRNILIEISNLIIDNLDSGDTENASILASIPITVSQGSIITYSNIYGIKNRVNTVKNLNNLHVRLLNDNLNIIDMNGVNWSLTLQIQYYT